MKPREDHHDDEPTKTDRLAELWSELLELRQKVRQAENLKQRNKKGRPGSDGN